MKIFDRLKHKRNGKTSNPSVAYFLAGEEGICVPGYTSLDKCPEIMTACFKIAQIISTITIHLMENAEGGDKRIINELSRKIDIEQNSYMTRQTWLTSIVMNMLLYGHGNSIVLPVTKEGLLDSLIPIPADRVSLMPSFSSSTQVWEPM